MTFKQIDERFHLLNEYLQYRIELWHYTPWGRLYTLRTTGMIFCYELMTFDQWLFQNGHEDLVIY